MKNKTKKCPKSLWAMSIRLAAGTMAVWLVCMACMTIAVAEALFHILLGLSDQYQEQEVEQLRFRLRDESFAENRQLPGFLEDLMLMRLDWDDRPGTYINDTYTDDDGAISLLRDVHIPVTMAKIYADQDGNVIQKSRDFLCFYYFTEEHWERENREPTGIDGYAWIDLSDAEDSRYRFFRGEYSPTGMFWTLVRNMRITGVMDGNRIEPLKMDIKSVDMRIDHDMYLKYGLKDTGDGWTNLFDMADTTEAQGELVTIYTGYPDMCLYDPGEPMGAWKPGEAFVQGSQEQVIGGSLEAEGYESLLHLLDTMRQEFGDAIWAGNLKGNYFQKLGLDEIVLFDKMNIRQYINDPNWGEHDFVVYTAFRAYPIRSAIILLRNVYIGTFLLALVVFWRLRKSFRKNLIRPVTAVNEAMEQQYRNLPEYQEKPPAWPEYDALINNYKVLYDKLRAQGNEINRLETALKYAKAAEAKRRKMTSNIAHELKTPLAVVHSYAEGLQEHIAEEKREQYLQTILSETERMDAMVLEMLDLSRLEAGKVKLARDDFDLAALAKSVFDALAIKSEEKGLQVTLELDEPVMVSADEGRIRQVLENYASNAVKYTPESGKVTAKIRQERGKTTFLLENESAPLPPEALVRVWDSFYRVDDSRTGRSGTGLGLAIAKSIVELHGGSVDVRNTKTGVEFRFTI